MRLFWLSLQKLDSTPTHSYMKYLYKYPQAAYPYADLVETNQRRSKNDKNHEWLFPGQKNESPYVKDGINNCVVQGNQGAVNPGKQGTKVAADYRVKVDAGQSRVIRLRLSKSSPDQKREPFGKQFDDIFTNRLREADEFYKSVTPPLVSEDAAKVMRQAIAGRLCSKQVSFCVGANGAAAHGCNPLH